MRKRIWFVAFFLASFQVVFAGEITLEGVYLGKNVFIRNPYISESNSFCIMNIYVNGAELFDLPKSSAIQVDLKGFSLNDPVVIRVIHKDGCLPVFINPSAITNQQDFGFLFTQIDDNSINWITAGETPGGYYIIEKDKWRGWEPADSIGAKGQIDNNQYSLETHHYSGDNQYRIIYHSLLGETSTSEEVVFYSLLPPITIYPTDKVIDFLSLSRPTDYEIYDEYDKLVMKGFAEDINVESLPYGEYSIIIENEPILIYKPKPEIIRRKRRRKNDSSKN